MMIQRFHLKMNKKLKIKLQCEKYLNSAIKHMQREILYNNLAVTDYILVNELRLESDLINSAKKVISCISRTTSDT